MNKFVLFIRILGILICMHNYYLIIKTGKLPLFRGIEISNWTKWLLALLVLLLAEAVILVTKREIRKIKKEEDVEICPKCEKVFRSGEFVDCPDCKLRLQKLKGFYREKSSRDILY